MHLTILQIENSLSFSIEVLYHQNDGKLTSISKIEPKETLDVPMRVVYTMPQELFFKVCHDKYVYGNIILLFFIS